MSFWLARPLLLMPRSWRRVWLPAGVTLFALSPFGALTPLHAAAAFFPGMGAWGLLGAVVLLIAVGHSGRCSFRTFLATSGVIALIAVAANALYRLPPLPPDVWALRSTEGRHPADAKAWAERQQRMSMRVVDDVMAGARLVVTPESTVDRPDVVYWLHAYALTGGRAQILVGYQTDGENYLLDFPSGRRYRGAVPMVVGMWHPWRPKDHFPIRMDALFDLVDTHYGRVPYLLCYEETLLWPLAAKMLVADRPPFFISAANQWFTDAAPGARVAQDRSLYVNARLWGVAPLRAVNLP